ncbi:AAA family ATPase [Pseudomonas chlororaphis]|uniref:AAA family ATPase n=1 Tax=Pseudomonas chlororaphis TaxID=587753 RepID=UPI000D1061DF|nr:AAA family ATPase [Pseudomonas chlororaphis]AVO62247.1 ATP-binding protein [Pseudomonas chlororaphis subsp. piscium]
MARINSYHHDGVTIDLIKPSRLDDCENVFTVVVGKNGVGKSRLLAEIAKRFSVEKTPDDNYGRYTGASDKYGQEPKVIAVSTSPFDKFPARRKVDVEGNTNYRYVGMRGEGLYQVSSAVSLISSAAKGLLDQLLVQSANHNLLSVFESLNFSSVVDFIFKPGYIKSRSGLFVVDIVEDPSLEIELRNLDRDYGIQVDERYYDNLRSLSLSRRHKVIHSMIKVNQFLSHRKAVELTVNFAGGLSRLDGVVTDDAFIEALLVLMNAGLMRLMDLRLQKVGFGEMSLKRASSGEQCLLVLMLGIAGHISNGSLILIDEPEISLHPRWQEEFMMMLMKSFSSYSGCHFIIATHSPQIIARLNSRACFITSLSKQKVYDARDFYQRSADYQLAELFDAPGIMNEYISRLAFNLLARVKASKVLSEESFQDLERLLDLDIQVEQGDPVKELISSVVEMCRFYADN